MTLTKLLETNIKKLNLPLKNEEEIKEILKKRLTKKEYKILIFMLEDKLMKDQLEKLSLDTKRYEEIKIKLFKKINFQNLKEELMIDEKKS
jgi:hypothetical protein